jgi:hypothetical protein
MHRRVWMALALPAVVACSSGDSGGGGGEDSGLLPSGVADSSAFVFDDDAASDAGPLLRSCTPGSTGSCPTGFTCYGQHTSSSWWVDLYGTCTFDCTNQTIALCESLDGICGCPVLQGQSSCSDDAGTALVCIPAVKPGSAPGSTEGDGGCGNAGCGGGPPLDASGAISGDE